MLTNKLRTLLTISLLAIMFGLSGCMALGKVSGGGWLEGAEGGKANLGFNAAQCEAGWIDGSFTYHDKKANKLRISGEVTDAGLCQGSYDRDLGRCDSCEAAWGASAIAGCTAYQVEFDYVTQGKVKETGAGFACVLDCGEGANALADGVHIALESGPHAGYSNFGSLEGGNIQAGTCTCTDGLNNDDDEFTDGDDVDCQLEDGSFNPNGDEDTPQLLELL